MQPDTNAPVHTAAVVLAAGQASRMGRAKTLLDFHGEALVRRAARTALDAGYDNVLVVVADYTDAVGDALSGLPVSIVVNPRAPEGIGTSIAAGVLALEPHVTHAAIVLSDQPLVTSQYLAELRARACASPRLVVASRYADTLGVPALFARETFPALAALNADHGCKRVILELQESAVILDYPEAAIDIDTPDDYDAATKAG